MKFYIKCIAIFSPDGAVRGEHVPVLCDASARIIERLPGRWTIEDARRLAREHGGSEEIERYAPWRPSRLYGPTCPQMNLF